MTSGRTVSPVALRARPALALLAALLVVGLLASGCVPPGWWGGCRTVCPPRVTHDGAGGAVVVYGLFEPVFRLNGYVQRIDAAGNRLWGRRGALLCSSPPPTWSPEMVADGAGGVIVLWWQEGLVAQRVDPEGHVLWRSENLLMPAPDAAVSDGAGGAIVCAEDEGVFHILKVDSEGGFLWTENGVPLRLEDAEYAFHMASDDRGGAVIVWRGQGARVRAQRVGSGGDVLWQEGGLELNPNASGYYPSITGDGSGGAVAAWGQSERQAYGQSGSVYAQRIAPGGEILWQEGGVLVHSNPGVLGDTRIVGDGSGGATVIFQDAMDVYAQRVGPDGGIEWVEGGVKVEGSEGPQSTSYGVTADGSGGVIIVFEKGTGKWQPEPCYAQKLDAAGRNCWLPDGTLVSTQRWHPYVGADGLGGVLVICWPYVQRIDAKGERLWGESGVLLPPLPGYKYF